ncbi:hypothetical protein HanIR_Chr07g0334331 [Helianthus annuus]|nr:hypothetical protein HanIR_Chr07g0334331 [Helianthus annuus]
MVVPNIYAGYYPFVGWAQCSLCLFTFTTEFLLLHFQRLHKSTSTTTSLSNTTTAFHHPLSPYHASPSSTSINK